MDFATLDRRLRFAFHGVSILNVLLGAARGDVDGIMGPLLIYMFCYYVVWHDWK